MLQLWQVSDRFHDPDDMSREQRVVQGTGLGKAEEEEDDNDGGGGGTTTTTRDGARLPLASGISDAIRRSSVLVSRALSAVVGSGCEQGGYYSGWLRKRGQLLEDEARLRLRLRLRLGGGGGGV